MKYDRQWLTDVDLGKKLVRYIREELLLDVPIQHRNTLRETFNAVGQSFDYHFLAGCSIGDDVRHLMEIAELAENLIEENGGQCAVYSVGSAPVL